ncbi:response regulator [Cohnella soli]|uniref:Response regulator n=1 Tax=Cohnella soli TaxID=425005 RepID=A0ABW0HL73_9BACL
MLNVLIVDDEIHFVEAVKRMVDWAGLDVANVYVAYSSSAAEQAFQAHDIHVLLCDIEMPQRTGLELLEWMRQKKLRTVPVLMTCHADFRFAQEAVRLGCSDYLLKPLSKEELETAIHKAAQTAIREQERMEAQRNKLLWSHQQILNLERFWTDLLSEAIPANRGDFLREAAARQISACRDAEVLPILMVVRHWHQDFRVRDRKLLEYALKNAGKELIGRLKPGSVFVPVDSEAWLLMMSVDPDQRIGENELAIMCRRLVEFCQTNLYCDLTCYGGQAIPGHEVSSMLRRLLRLDRNNVNGVGYVSLAAENRSVDASMALPDMSGWAALLRQGVKERLLEEAAAFIGKLRHRPDVDSRYLLAFKENFLQMTHAVLQQQGVQAHLMFCDEGSVRLAEAASRSLADLERWLAHVIANAAGYAQASSMGDVVERATRFILSNLDQNLSREAIAGHVYLHPDYLTRLFKKELGCTIPEFIMGERIKLAKQLLTHSELPVSAVSMAIGYANFSHFSKLFKQQTGLTPVEFRQSERGGANGKVEITSG